MANVKERLSNMGYRIYITDSLQLSAQDKYLTVRYADLIKPKKVDQRTGDEIAAQVIKELGLRV